VPSLCSLGAVIPFQGVRPIPGSPSHSRESVPFQGVRPIPGTRLMWLFVPERGVSVDPAVGVSAG